MFKGCINLIKDETIKNIIKNVDYSYQNKIDQPEEEEEDEIDNDDDDDYNDDDDDYNDDDDT